MAVLRVLLVAGGKFETTAILQEENRAAIMLRIRLGDAKVMGSMIRMPLVTAGSRECPSNGPSRRRSSRSSKGALR